MGINRKIKISASLILFLFATNCFLLSQNNKTDVIIDSLLQSLNNANSDTLKADIYVELSNNFRRTDPERAIQYAEKALLVYQRMNNQNGIIRAYLVLGTGHMNKSNYLSAFDYLNKASDMAIEIGDNKSLSRAKNNIGIIYMKQENYKMSLKYYQESLKLRKALGVGNEIAPSLNNIGNVYYYQENYEEALNYYQQTLLYFEPANNGFGLAGAYGNIGRVYEKMNKTKEALHYYHKSLFYWKSINDIRGMGSIQVEIGSYFYEDNILDSAQYYVSNALENSLNSKDWINVIDAKIVLAKIYIKAKEYNKANQKLDACLELLKQEKSPSKYAIAYNVYSDLCIAKGDFKSALEYKNLNIQYNDSFNFEKFSAELVNQELSAEFAERETKIREEQLRKNIITEERIRGQRIIIWISVGAGAVVFILLIFSFKAYLDKKRDHIIIENQKKLVDEKQMEIIDSITYAKKLQQALLPGDEKLKKSFPNHFVLYLPKDIVAGDFYWTAEVKVDENSANKLNYLAVCDCTGHGVPGAFMSLLNIGLLSEALKERNIHAPHLVFEYVRKRLIESIGNEGQQDGMDGILICIDEKNHQINYVAANNAPLLVSKGIAKKLPVDKMHVGLTHVSKQFTLQTVKYEKGDVLYLYTDGFADQFGGENLTGNKNRGKKYMLSNFNKFLTSISDKDTKEQCKLLNDEFHNWRKNLAQIDDVLVVGIRL
ncbi:MAG: tetratricopeptide repeat protein [Sphingobacteriaceae bacterium]|nr:tetratricopeptide repeat protein [Sphingobacteriaceae bacterium]